MEEDYEKFINEQEYIVRECMPAGFYLIENVPKDMLPLLLRRFNDYKTETTPTQEGKYLFAVKIGWKN